MQLRGVDEGSSHSEDRTDAWAGEWNFNLREGQVCVGTYQLGRQAGKAAAARWRWLPRDRVEGSARHHRGEVQEHQAGAWAGCAWIYRLVEVHQRGELPDAEAGTGRD